MKVSPKHFVLCLFGNVINSLLTSGLYDSMPRKTPMEGPWPDNMKATGRDRRFTLAKIHRN